MDQLIGIIWDVSKFLCSCCKQEADYVRNLGGNLQSLEEKWANMKAIEEDVKAKIAQVENTGEMRRTQQLQLWLQNVEAIQKKAEDIIVEGKSEIQKKCLCECCPKNCISSYKFGKNVAKMLKDVDDLVITGESFIKNFGIGIAQKLPLKCIEMPPDEIVGLALMLEKVWNSIEEDNVGVIGLYGMGGAGKTTLCKRINNELGLRRPDFNYVMWVVVSKDVNVDSIMDKIRKKLGIEDDFWKRCSDQDEKTAKIYQVLKRKKFVLILDDIWEQVDLKMIGVPHPKDNNFQSKVLFTTRSEDLCAKMDVQRKFKVECLNKEEAIELFCKKVGDDTLKSHPDIPKLAMEMAAECKGLPLALIVLGSAMSGKKSLEAWEYSKNNIKNSSWTALNLEKKVLSILKFSYDQLPDETHKNCFLYCALYPEDYEIPVRGLIEKWIGEGFLRNERTKSIQTMRDYGEFVIDKLKSSCLLESVEDDIFVRRTIKMHDVIRDMALWLARDEDKNQNKILVEEDVGLIVSSQDNVETRENVERISIIKFHDLHIQVATFPNLTTLLLESNDGQLEVTGLSNFQYMKKLKVLVLKCNMGNIEVPAEIDGLVLLEYLALEGEMWASTFPSELKNLKNLKLLSLEICDSGSIPLEVISSLEQLRLLRFTSMSEIEGREEIEFLEKLESLPNLEELWIQLRTENGLKKLLESTKLQSCMRLLILYQIDMDTKINMQLVLECMSRMKHLLEIEFRFSYIEDCSIFASCSLRMLQSARFFELDSVTHLTWLKYASLLQFISISDCNSLEEVIKGEIEEEEEEEEEGKGRDNMDNIFSSLVVLIMSNLPKLKSIHKTPLSFPSLRSIHIRECPKLNKLPFDSSSLPCFTPSSTGGCSVNIQQLQQLL